MIVFSANDLHSLAHSSHTVTLQCPPAKVACPRALTPWVMRVALFKRLENGRSRSTQPAQGAACPLLSCSWSSPAHWGDEVGKKPEEESQGSGRKPSWIWPPRHLPECLLGR